MENIKKYWLVAVFALAVVVYFIGINNAKNLRI